MTIVLIIIASLVGYLFIAFLFLASWTNKFAFDLRPMLYNPRNRLIWALLWPIYLLVVLLGNIIFLHDIMAIRRKRK